MRSATVFSWESRRAGQLPPEGQQPQSRTRRHETVHWSAAPRPLRSRVYHTPFGERDVAHAGQSPVNGAEIFSCLESRRAIMAHHGVESPYPCGHSTSTSFPMTFPLPVNWASTLT